jgi:hypothetical protein
MGIFPVSVAFRQKNPRNRYKKQKDEIVKDCVRVVNQAFFYYNERRSSVYGKKMEKL